MNKHPEGRSGTLSLVYFEGIQLGSQLLTQEDIRRNNAGNDNRRGIVRGATLTERDDDLTILTEILATCAPLKITGDPDFSPLFFTARLGRYQIPVSEGGDHEAFSANMKLDRGRISSIEAGDTDLGTVQIDWRPGEVVLDAANGRVQLYFFTANRRDNPDLVPPRVYSPNSPAASKIPFIY